MLPRNATSKKWNRIIWCPPPLSYNWGGFKVQFFMFMFIFTLNFGHQRPQEWPKQTTKGKKANSKADNFSGLPLPHDESWRIIFSENPLIRPLLIGVVHIAPQYFLSFHVYIGRWCCNIIRFLASMEEVKTYFYVSNKIR